MKMHYHLPEIQGHHKNNYNEKKKFIKFKLVIVACCYGLLCPLLPQIYILKP